MKFVNLSVDSFSTITPIEFFQEVNPNLDGHIVTFNESTGEVIDMKKGTPVFLEEFGVKFRASRVSLFGDGDGILITFNSKMLRERIMTYVNSKQLEGLNSQNFRYAFDYCMEMIGCKIEFLPFIQNAKVFDVDLKGDFNMSENQFESLCMKYAHHVEASVHRVRYHKNHPMVITGLEMAKRDTATLARPFFKFYSKLRELEERDSSAEFHKRYIPMFNNPYYRRCEVTVKNSRAWARMARKKVVHDKYSTNFTLAKLFSLTDSEIHSVINFMLTSYEPRLKIDKSEPKLGPDGKPLRKMKFTSRMVRGRMIYELILAGHTFKQIVHWNRMMLGSENKLRRASERAREQYWNDLIWYVATFRSDNDQIIFTKEDAYLKPREAS